jgi:ribosomal protein S18 acetylase RimI-like enzyme
LNRFCDRFDCRFIGVDSPLYPAELALRFRILREPLGHDFASVRFAFEDDSYHLVAVDRGKVFGCVLFHPDGAGGGRLYQMAVDDMLQGQGIGAHLVALLEDELEADGLQRVELHARGQAIGFYQRCGYRCVGEPFEEVGVTHRLMEKDLVTS